ncbi:MAG: hypothetical protein HRF46_02065 [Acidobacteriota bacterium]
MILRPMGLPVCGIFLVMIAFPVAAEDTPAAAKTPSWRPIGPWGGHVLFEADRDGSRLWATTVRSMHLHVSDDQGRTWRWLGSPCPGFQYCWRQPSPHSPEVFLAIGPDSVLLRSVDGGSSWHEARVSGGGATLRQVVSVAFDEVDASLASALASEGTLYRSNDGGESWDAVRQLPLTPGRPAVVMPLPGARGNLLVAAQSLVLCQDGVAACTVLHPSLPTGQYTIGLSPAGDIWLAMNRTVLHAASITSPWQDASEGLDAFRFVSEPPVRQFQFDPASGSVYALTSAGILRRGLTEGRWELALPLPDPPQRSDDSCGWLLLEEGHLLSCGDDGPYLCREDDGRCESRTLGLAGLLAYAVEMDATTGQVGVVATSRGLFRFDGASWVRVEQVAGLNFRGASLARSPNATGPIVLASGHGSGAIQASFDGGLSWRTMGLSFLSANNEERVPLTLASHRGDVLLAGDGWDLWRSADAGASWTLAPITAEALAVNPRNPNDVWAAFQRRLQRSLDAGASWFDPWLRPEDHVVATCPPGWCWNWVVTALAVDPFNAQRVLMGTASSGLYSWQGGGELRPVATGLPLITNVAFDPDRPGHVLVAGGQYWGGQSGQVLKSEDGGASWSPLGGDQPLPSPRDLRVSFRSGRIAVATEGGVFLLEDTPRDNRPLRRSAPARR